MSSITESVKRIFQASWLPYGQKSSQSVTRTPIYGIETPGNSGIEIVVIIIWSIQTHPVRIYIQMLITPYNHNRKVLSSQ